MTDAALLRLRDGLGIPFVSDETALRRAIGQGVTLVFFPGDPVRVREAADVAAILPELPRALSDRFGPIGLIVVPETDDSRALRASLGAAAPPSILACRDGAVLGSVQRMRDWAEYLGKLTRLLSKAA